VDSAGRVDKIPEAPDDTSGSHLNGTPHVLGIRYELSARRCPRRTHILVKCEDVRGTSTTLGLHLSMEPAYGLVTGCPSADANTADPAVKSALRDLFKSFFNHHATQYQSQLTWISSSPNEQASVTSTCCFRKSAVRLLPTVCPARTTSRGRAICREFAALSLGSTFRPCGTDSILGGRWMASEWRTLVYAFLIRNGRTNYGTRVGQTGLAIAFRSTMVWGRSQIDPESAGRQHLRNLELRARELTERGIQPVRSGTQ